MMSVDVCVCSVTSLVHGGWGGGTIALAVVQDVACVVVCCSMYDVW